MAVTHPNEQELYGRIEKENLKVPFHIWDLFYHYIGDDITAIVHIASFAHLYKEPIDIPNAKKIVEHTQRIRFTMDKILHPEKINDEESIEDIKNLKNGDTKLHPVINELFTHYLGNDVYGINMIACYHLDPKDETPIPLEDVEKILAKTATMKQFMDRLSEVTNQKIHYIRKEAE